MPSDENLSFHGLPVLQGCSVWLIYMDKRYLKRPQHQCSQAKLVHVSLHRSNAVNLRSHVQNPWWETFQDRTENLEDPASSHLFMDACHGLCVWMQPCTLANREGRVIVTWASRRNQYQCHLQLVTTTDSSSEVARIFSQKVVCFSANTSAHYSGAIALADLMRLAFLKASSQRCEPQRWHCFPCPGWHRGPEACRWKQVASVGKSRKTMRQIYTERQQDDEKSRM